MKIFLSLIAVISLLQPLIATAETEHLNAQPLDLNGRWEVLPADAKSVSSFVIGEMKLVQTGNQITGSYILTKNDKIAICSSLSYKIKGTIHGNKVVLSAVGSKSKLTGSATGNSNTLTGSGMELFQGTICSGYVNSSFVMNKI
jgi:5,10-methylene-tetrahydrofolate dehydrogenase/methenyl tetrahydrofolate cyclohydrolase